MSLVLAKILGLYLLAIGIAFIINPDRFRKFCAQATKDENTLFFGGMFALLFGAIVVGIHNVWVIGWPLIITLLGWWGVIKGFGLLISEKFIKIFSFIQSRSNLFYRTISAVYILIGLFLAYKGWS